MQISRDRVVGVLRLRGDEDAAHRAEDELPEHFDPDDHTEVLLAYGVDLQDLDDQETFEETAADAGAQELAPTGLGSGTGSGLGHSLTSEPDPLLGGPDEAR